MIDMHSHFLFGIDDGAKSVDESVDMLKEMYLQGISVAVATPHFNPYEKTIEQFLAARNASLRAVVKRAEERHASIPKIVPGAEVLLCEPLSSIDGITRLCIDNTDYMLIEFPHNDWNIIYINLIYNISVANKFTPIIAHIDRYFSVSNSKRKITSICNLNCPIQMNCDALFNSFKKRLWIKKLINHGKVNVIGTDCHNLTSRPPNMDKAVKKLKSMFGDELVDNFEFNAQSILNNDEII